VSTVRLCDPSEHPTAHRDFDSCHHDSRYLPSTGILADFTVWPNRRIQTTPKCMCAANNKRATSTPTKLAMNNQIDRFNLVIGRIDRLHSLELRLPMFKERIEEEILRTRAQCHIYAWTLPKIPGCAGGWSLHEAPGLSLTRPVFSPSPLQPDFSMDPYRSAPRPNFLPRRAASRTRSGNRTQRRRVVRGNDRATISSRLGSFPPNANHHTSTGAHYAVREQLMTATSRIEAISATPTPGGGLSLPAEFLTRSQLAQLLIVASADKRFRGVQPSASPILI